MNRLAVLCLSLLIVALDATVLHMAVPALTEDLRPGDQQLQWIVDACPLIAASLLILFGALGDRIGRRRVLLRGYALFGAASALAAVGAAVGPVLDGQRGAVARRRVRGDAAAPGDGVRAAPPRRRRRRRARHASSRRRRPYALDARETEP